MGCLSYNYPMRILCCFARFYARDGRDGNLNKKHFLKTGAVWGRRVSRRQKGYVVVLSMTTRDASSPQSINE